MKILLLIPAAIIFLFMQLSPVTTDAVKYVVDVGAVVGVMVFLWKKFNAVYKSLNEIDKSIKEQLWHWRNDQTDHIARLEGGQKQLVKGQELIMNEISAVKSDVKNIDTRVAKLETEHNLFHKQLLNKD